MKRFLFFVAAAMSMIGMQAQPQLTKYKPGVTTEGAVYYLPKTAIRIVVKVEKTEYTPGEFATYAQRFLRLNDVATQPSTSYRMIDIGFSTFGVADSAKCYSLKFNPKNPTPIIELSEQGVLLAINANPMTEKVPAPFVAAPKNKREDPRQYMNEEILSAGSKAKMAQLTAEEIYNLRESKNMLNRGEADFMPKDGEQLRIMLANLDKQDRMLSSLFSGYEEKDTMEQTFVVCPDAPVERQVIFRLSKHLGLVDADDLSGIPYYICIEDLNSVKEPVEDLNVKKKKKVDFDAGIYVNVPDKAKATIYKDAKAMGSIDFVAGQFGNVELLSGELFTKKVVSHLTLNPTTGSVAKLQVEELGK